MCDWRYSVKSRFKIKVDHSWPPKKIEVEIPFRIVDFNANLRRQKKALDFECKKEKKNCCQSRLLLLLIISQYSKICQKVQKIREITFQKQIILAFKVKYSKHGFEIAFFFPQNRSLYHLQFYKLTVTVTLYKEEEFSYCLLSSIKFKWTSIAFVHFAWIV